MDTTTPDFLPRLREAVRQDDFGAVREAIADGCPDWALFGAWSFARFDRAGSGMMVQFLLEQGNALFARDFEREERKRNKRRKTREAPEAGGAGRYF